LELLGPNHIDVAFSWHDLAVANRKVGLVDESIRCRKKALEIFIKKYGMVNPNVATEYNGLGVVYQDKGLLEKAFEFYNKGLEIKLKTLGENNPDVAYSYDNFALYYAAKNDYNKAIEYQKKALDIRLASFGAKNREVATSYFNISNFYNNLALYDKAIEYQKISIETLKSDSVKNSYPLAIFYSGLSESLSAKKKYDEAIIEQSKSLTALRKIFGDENPTVAKAYRKLAKCYVRYGDLETANSLYKLSLRSLRYFEGGELSGVNSLKELKYTLIGKALFENVRFSQTSNPIFLKNAQRDWKLALDLISKENADQFESEIENNLEIFQGSIDTYLRLQREGQLQIIDELFNLFEVSKSLLLRSAIKESNASALSGIDTSLLQRESRLRINITWRESILDHRE
jgi:tetratricopeptide (TPR) repeat protein